MPCDIFDSLAFYRRQKKTNDGRWWVSIGRHAFDTRFIGLTPFQVRG